ncbi:MAG: hypothetical protein IKO46_05905 [Salinivirgaceae bacterium]|nr:hypothetical protein [Salinivirgaceae bacterium]
MNWITKILSLLATAFAWVAGRSRERKNNKREDERFHRESIIELRKSNDEMIVRLAQLYKEVLESKREIMSLQTENLQLSTQLKAFAEQNKQLSEQVKLLTDQNAILVEDIERRRKRRKA